MLCHQLHIHIVPCPQPLTPPRSKYLLGNPHRVTVVMLPDGELAKKTEEEETARLESARAALDKEGVSGRLPAPLHPGTFF